MPEKKKQPKLFHVPITGAPASMESDETRETLRKLKSIYDKGGPTKPVVSLPRFGSIERPYGFKRINKTVPFSDSPLAQHNPIDAIFGEGALESLTSLENIEKGPAGLAGAPFSAYKSKNIERVFHGTPKLKQVAEEGFDPRHYNVNDVLGHMTHAAEPSPLKDSGAAYANIYAEKHGYPTLKSDYENLVRGAEWNPGVIPLKPEAKNVLDLIDPNPDDLAQAVAQIKNPRRKREIIDLFKHIRRASDPTRSARTEISPNHFNQIDPESLKKQPATHVLADKIRLEPHEIETMPHDAIRYFDTRHKSWAFPARTPLKSQFGAPLNAAAKMEESPMKMIKWDDIHPAEVPKSGLPILSKPRNRYEEELMKAMGLEDVLKLNKPSPPVGGSISQKQIDSVINTGNGYDAKLKLNLMHDEGMVNDAQYDKLIKKINSHFYGAADESSNAIDEAFTTLDKYDSDATHAIKMSEDEINDVMKKFGSGSHPPFKIGDVITLPGTGIEHQIVKNEDDLNNVLSHYAMGGQVDVVSKSKQVDIPKGPNLKSNKWTPDQMDMVLGGHDKDKNQAWEHIEDMYDSGNITGDEYSHLWDYIAHDKFKVPVKNTYNEFTDKNLIGNKYKVTGPEGQTFDVVIKDKSDVNEFLAFKEKGYKFDKIK